MGDKSGRESSTRPHVIIANARTTFLSEMIMVRHDECLRTIQSPCSSASPLEEKRRSFRGGRWGYGTQVSTNGLERSPPSREKGIRGGGCAMWHCDERKHSPSRCPSEPAILLVQLLFTSLLGVRRIGKEFKSDCATERLPSEGMKTILPRSTVQ